MARGRLILEDKRVLGTFLRVRGDLSAHKAGNPITTVYKTLEPRRITDVLASTACYLYLSLNLV
jgi:hypothetical protein